MSDAQALGIIASVLGTFLAIAFVFEWINDGIVDALKMVGFILGGFAVVAALVTFWFFIWGVFP